MGFFSDLKEDLSQAVNEMLPEDAENTQEETTDGVAKNAVEETVEAASTEPAAEVQEPETELTDLSAMLDKVTAESETEKAPEKPVEKRSEGFAKRMDALKTADETATITEGMAINGDITSTGSLDLLGSITGNIVISGKLNVTGNIQGNSRAAEIYADNARINGEVVSEGSVKIGQSSVIIGNISAMSAVIAGAVKGDIDVHGPVILDASAIVMGNIKSKSVQINNGAVIEGMCSQCYAEVNASSLFDRKEESGSDQNSKAEENAGRASNEKGTGKADRRKGI